MAQICLLEKEPDIWGGELAEPGLSDIIGGDPRLDEGGDCNGGECMWPCEEMWFEPNDDIFECNEVGKEGIAEGTDAGIWGGMPCPNPK